MILLRTWARWLARLLDAFAGVEPLPPATLIEAPPATLIEAPPARVDGACPDCTVRFMCARLGCFPE